MKLLSEALAKETSSRKHELYADRYSLAVEDMPMIEMRHARAIGLVDVKSRLGWCPSYGEEFRELYSVMRKRVEGYLTAREIEYFFSL